MTVKELLANYEPRLRKEGMVKNPCTACAFSGVICSIRDNYRYCELLADAHGIDRVDIDKVYLVRKEERSFVGYVAVDGLGAFLCPKYPPVQNPVNKFWHPAPESEGCGHSTVVVVPRDFLGDRMPAEGEAPVRVTLTVKVE